MVVCWSPKGKQIAIGVESGDLLTFSPNDTLVVKTKIPRPSSVEATVVSAAWLSSTDFHCIYIPSGPRNPEVEQSHVVISLDAKAGKVSEVKLGTPYLNIPGLRPPGSFMVVLRHWDPAKYLLFIGDSTSSDIGLLGCTETNGKDSWANFTLEETSTPSMPLDKEMMDTIIVGLALDLTGTESFTHKNAAGEDVVLPPPPIMLAYASDGTVIGWNLLNTTGKPYPGMRSSTAQVQQTVSENMDSDMLDKPAAEAMISQPATAPEEPSDQSMAGDSTSTSTPAPAPSTPAATSVFGQTGIGQSSTFGKTTSRLIHSILCLLQRKVVGSEHSHLQDPPSLVNPLPLGQIQPRHPAPRAQHLPLLWLLQPQIASLKQTQKCQPTLLLMRASVDCL